MLSTLLPGVREVRAPLAAGYLWLLGLWLLLEPSVHNESDHSELLNSLGRLGEAMSPVGLGIVVSVVAYLLGALVDGLLQGLRRASLAFTRDSGATDPPRSVSPRIAYSLELIEKEQTREAERRLRSAGRSPRHLYARIESPRQEMRGELSLIATRLMSESPEHFATLDRLRSEAALRYAVAMSLPIVLIAASVRSGLWWLLGLLVTVPLFIQGWRRAREADDVLADAILIGKVEPPAIERLRRLVDEIIEEPHPGDVPHHR